jgi:nucleotide-binding universal stress UspA family protein/amino acid transporter
LEEITEHTMSAADNLAIHRPRNVDWKRAAAILYGDLGTSKAYVIGLAFLAAGYSSLPIILAVCALTGVVAFNYVIICKHFPDGGGVYSAARDQSRTLAVVGALLLVADLTVTACLSAWTGLRYLGIPDQHMMFSTVALILLVGLINLYGPKHSGSIAAVLAVPTFILVVVLCLICLPHLTVIHLEPTHQSFGKNWKAFVGVILALSGIEAIANLTGVMRLDKGTSLDRPDVMSTARLAIWPVALEVVLGTAIMGWAMLSLPQTFKSQLLERKEDMLRFLSETYGAMTFGPSFGDLMGMTSGFVFGLLLLSAVNTAVVAMIGLIFMMARDGEMPKAFTRLNRHGVPRLPLSIAMILPVTVVTVVAMFQQETAFEALAALYAIGVVGAIAVNLGSCTFNMKISMAWWERALMGVTFFVLIAVELTIAKTKPDALFFAMCVLLGGLGIRGYAQRRAGLRAIIVPQEVAAAITPASMSKIQPRAPSSQRIMVAARGLTPVLRFAFEEARMRQAALYVLYVKEVAVALPGGLSDESAPHWQNDPQAASIMYAMLNLAKAHNVPVIPLYAVSGDPSSIVVDLCATLGADMLVLGASRRRFFAQLFKGDVITSIASDLPDNIELVIHG